MARRPSLRALALGWLSCTVVPTQCRSLSDQAPLHSNDARADEKILGEPASSAKPIPRSATIKLYAGSYGSNKYGSCSPSLPAETLSLAPEVCLSGDYYFHTNVALLDAPVCDDGNMPYMAIFKRRGCTGKRTWFDYSRTELPACFNEKKWPLGSSEFAEPSWSHWSMMFYCSHLEAAMATDGAEQHVLARPPSISAASRGAKAGTIRVFESESQCRSGQSVKEESLEAPSYLNLPAYIDLGTGFVSVAEPAFCTDGSRAQLALYKDVSCASHHHGGTHDHDAVVLDVADEDVGHRCVDVKDYTAVAFSCTGEGRLPTAKGFLDPETSWWTLIVLALVGITAVFLIASLAIIGPGEIRRQIVRAPASFLVCVSR